MTTIDQIDDFAQFAKRLLAGGHNLTIDDLYDQWRRQALKDTDRLAVQASLRDVEKGERGQPVEEFLADFESQRKPTQQ